MYIRCIYGIFGREITKYTIIYSVYTVLTNPTFLPSPSTSVCLSPRPSTHLRPKCAGTIVCGVKRFFYCQVIGFRAQGSRHQLLHVCLFCGHVKELRTALRSDAPAPARLFVSWACKGMTRSCGRQEAHVICTLWFAGNSI